MNKEVNLYLNITGFTTFLISFLLLFISFQLESSTSTTIYLFRNLLLILAMLSGAIFILIEILLFMILNTKMKALLIIYMLLDIVMAIYINNLYPYSFVLVFIGFRIIKDISRVIFVEKIYIPRKLNKYLRIYNIKISDLILSKKKTTKLVKKKKIVTIAKKKNIVKKKAEV